MATYVLVHGAWHTGAELEPTAAPIRAAGHEVHTPTIAGNKPGDPKTVGLSDAIKSIVDYLTEKNLKDVILVGHSYGGMVITGVADQVPNRIRRLVYWNAFVPNNGESLNDMVPPPYVTLFEQIAAQRGDSSLVLPFPIWREAFINNVDLASAQKAYDILNPHPAKTFSDKISLKKIRPICRSPSPTSIARKTHRCRITIRGTHGCRRNWGYSDWFRFPAATSFASQIRSFLRRRSWTLGVIN